MRLTVRQFIDADCDDNPSEVLTDQEILDTVKITDPNSESDSDDEPPKLHIPTISEAQCAGNAVIRFLKHEKQTSDIEINKSLTFKIFYFNWHKIPVNKKPSMIFKKKSKIVCSLI